MINLGGIQQATSQALALGGLMLVSPQRTVGMQAQNKPSWRRDTSPLPPALLFNYEGENRATLTSDVTDHYIENNTSIQDQVALRPIEITTQGFIGELNDVAPVGVAEIKEAAERLTAISAYEPVISLTATRAYAAALAAYQTGASLANSAVAAWSTINGGADQGVINGSGLEGGLALGAEIPTVSTQTKQQIYFQQFYGYWKARKLFTIQTPWAVFQDMVIMRLTATQSPETDVISDFEVTFKQMRFASSIILGRQNLLQQQYESDQAQGRLQSQAAREVDLGTNVLERSPTPFPF